MNIFQRIGNNIEKEKLEKKKFLNKYWKLSSQERMEYYFKSKDVVENHFNIFWFAVKMIFYVIVGVLISSLFYKNILNLFFTHEVFYSLRYILGFSAAFEIFLIGLDRIIIQDKLKELNKRFKL